MGFQKRPVLISIIAVLMALKAILLLPAAVTTPQPYVLFGIIITGQAGQLAWLAFLVIQLIFVFGLLRLQEWARIGTIVLFIFSFLNFWVFGFVQVVMQAGGDLSQISADWTKLGIDTAYSVFVVWALFKYRAVFQKRV
ncbi:MAG: hypothetical protein COV45_06130 [Deltaproteobacteria bacterium CG11_big_fil_rev_8_21_14_0_20_47_16]|nr:MAG: hypothetical protein COV45_06130 [Deltaproteobacteria bacterium CG11_big_fil_rev_8_21_14_0_20_47_16]